MQVILVCALLGACVLTTSARSLQQAYASGTSTSSGTYSPPPVTYTPPANAYPLPYTYTPVPATYAFEQWQKDALAYVNKYYRWEGKWPLSWDYSLKDSTEASVNESAILYYPYVKYPGEYDYNSLPKWGETTYKIPADYAYNGKAPWQVAVDYWYSEGQYYQNSYSAQSSNYTQLTWKASTGWWISTAKDTYNALYYTAHYYVPGNVKGYYGVNVPVYAPVTTTAGK